MIGSLYVVSAPSGAGKSSLVRALSAMMPDIEVSVSFTTRPQRPGEREGKEYHFVDRTQFEQMLRQQLFLEHAQVYGHCYGTSRPAVEDALGRGQDVLLEIDWQGGRQVREHWPDTVSIFILPPSLQALEERLVKRGQDSREVIARRLEGAKEEMRHHAEYTYLVVNDDFDRALADLQTILRARRLRTAAQVQALAPLIASLVA